MRLVHAAALTVAALLLASAASAQGLGDAATREKEKRKTTPAKPAKVYTEGDIGRSMAPVSAKPELPATAAAAAGGRPRKAAPARAGGEGQAGQGETQTEAETRGPAKAEARARRRPSWRNARPGAQGRGGLPGRHRQAPARAQRHERRLLQPRPGREDRLLDENKQKLAEVQGADRGARGRGPPQRLSLSRARGPARPARAGPGPR